MPQYERNPPLSEDLLLKDPLAQLERWLVEAAAAGLVEPTAIALATADGAGKPSCRMVLFKGVDDGRLTFYTNYESRKGRELATNPQAALVFWWDRLERQVRVEGRVGKLSAEVSERYFHSRPRISQLAAYTSRQSQLVDSRDELEARFADNERQFGGQPVPCPDHWGGYGLRPDLFEFWQGRAGRLHDRLQYRRGAADWAIERLEP